MLGVRPLRSGGVKQKGPLHRKLQAVLHQAWRAKAVTQESLAEAIGQSQENTGQYLRGGKAGALDLDQADSALRHIGSNLGAFLAGLPPRELSHAERVAKELETRSDLIDWVAALLRVPKTRLPAVLAQVNLGVFLATGRVVQPPAAVKTETTKAPRTRQALRKHR